MIQVVIIAISFAAGMFISIRFFGNFLDTAIGIKQKRGGSPNMVKNGPWVTHMGIGRKSTPLPEKAAIARIAMGGNDSEETIYWNAEEDSTGNPLVSSKDYNVVFNAKPQVNYDAKGFWSITVYGNDQFLVENPDNKYMLRSDSDFEKEDDTHFSFFLSQTKPDNPKNWIPLPQTGEPFSVTFRCYVPNDEMKTRGHDIPMPDIICLERGNP